MHYLFTRMSRTTYMSNSLWYSDQRQLKSVTTEALPSRVTETVLISSMVNLWEHTVRSDVQLTYAMIE